MEGDVERARREPPKYPSDKLSKMEKMDKADKLEKAEKMGRAETLILIRAGVDTMVLDGKEKEYLMEDEVGVLR